MLIRFRRVLPALSAIVMAAGLGLAAVSPTLADDDDRNGGRNNGGQLRADPFVFVGAPGDCGPDAGSNIVTSAWLAGMGLPDNGGDGALNSAPSTRRDPHLGLLLSKNGLTTDCSSAGARIRGVEGMLVTATTTLGYDYRGGGHCGAGAPRFNLTVQPPTGPQTSHFIGGCANGTNTPAPQDAQWWRHRSTLSNPGQASPPVLPGSRIRSLTLLFDEGTDTANAEDPNGVGLAVVDNIFVDGQYIRSGRGITPGDNGERGDPGDKHDHGPRGRGHDHGDRDD